MPIPTNPWDEIPSHDCLQKKLCGTYNKCLKKLAEGKISDHKAEG